MARKSSRTAPAPNRKGPRSPIVDHKTSNGHPQKQPPIDNPTNSPTANTAGGVTQSGAAEGNSCSTSSNGESDGEGSDADTSDGDEEIDDAGDGDVLAPSGLAVEECEDQAGHPIIHGERQSATEQREKVQTNGVSGPTSSSRVPKQIRRSGRKTPKQQTDDESDDECYDGVDDIIDSDEGEPDVEKLEEMNIIQSAECEASSKILVRASSKAMSETSEPWEGFDIDGGLSFSDVPYFDEQYGRTYPYPGILDSEVQPFQDTSVFEGFDSLPSRARSGSPPTRRVHFREPLIPRSDSSDIFSNDEDLNGLFSSTTAENSRPPETSSRSADDNGLDDGDDESIGGNSSGYETDFGDTTEDEDVPACATTRPEALLCHPSLSSMEIGTEATRVKASAGPSKIPSPFKVPATPSRHSKGPRLGTFTTNSTRSYAMIDSTGDNLIVKEAKRTNLDLNRVSSNRTSTANASPTLSQSTFAGTYDDSEFDCSEFSSHVPAADPMLAPGSESMADVLLPIGPTTKPQDHRSISSVFYPLESVDDVNTLYSAADENNDDNDNEYLFEEFIDFGGDSSGDDAMTLETVLPTPTSTSPTAVPTQIQPKLPSPTKASNDDLMAHFDKGVIGAFRQGQNQYHSHRSHTGVSLNRHAFKSARQSPTSPSVGLPTKRKMSGGFAPAGSLQSIPKRRMMQHS